MPSSNDMESGTSSQSPQATAHTGFRIMCVAWKGGSWAWSVKDWMGNYQPFYNMHATTELQALKVLFLLQPRAPLPR